MSVELFSVTIRCEQCDDVVSQTGKQSNNSVASILRAKIQSLGWKTTSEMIDGRQQIRDYCPSCSYELGVAESKS